jgi:hypothetical protein
MSLTLQRVLLALGVVALIALLVEIGLSVGATMHGNTPVRVFHETAGPYPLTVSLYKDPAQAGFALPFSVVAQSATHGALSISATSVPDAGVDATPVNASITPDASNPNAVQGAAEITVKGFWTLHIVVTGPQGQGTADIPIVATAPPPMPQWLGWLIGAIPLYGLLAFLFIQRGRKKAAGAAAA